VIDAEIVELPFATPLTTPVVELTVAAAVFDDDHVAPVPLPKLAPF